MKKKLQAYLDEDAKTPPIKHHKKNSSSIVQNTLWERSHSELRTMMNNKNNAVKLYDLPTNETAINSLADKLLRWAIWDSAQNINEFAALLPTSPIRFYALAEKSDYFKLTLEAVKNIIGTRREAFARTGTQNPHVIMKQQPLYDHDLAEFMTDQAQKSSSSNMTVIMETIPDCPDVKPRE